MTELGIKNFFSLADTKIKLTEQVKKYYGKEIAPNFNSFDFWRVDENKVSRILSFFLDPKQKHEQGDIYLKHFLRKFKLDFFTFGEDDKIDVQCELITYNGRRMDIVISKNSFEQVIVIENKIYASTADQNNQLKDYLNFLSGKTEHYCLIYLSPQGKVVSGNSISEDERIAFEAQERLRYLSYEEHMIDCLKEFGLLTDNIRVKSFLNDFEKTLKKMYMGEKDINSKQVVFDLVYENGKNLEIAFLVSNSLQEVKRHLKEKFQHQLVEIATELDLEIKELELKPSRWKNHRIRFSYEIGGILYGISRIDEGKDKIRFPEIDILIEQMLKERFNVSPWWPMYQHFYRNIENNQEFWMDIQNGKAKQRAKEFIKLINDNFNTEKY